MKIPSDMIFNLTPQAREKAKHFRMKPEYAYLANECLPMNVSYQNKHTNISAKNTQSVGRMR